jgi:PAS domain S-box-containing protein
MDLDGKHTFTNPGVTSILGYRIDEFIGQDTFPLIHPEDRTEVEARLPRLIAGKQGWRGWVVRWKHKNGEYRYLESNASPLENAAGELVGYMGADRDITDRIRLEEQFLQSQKMETIGRLAGGIAHDFNNLLTVINGNAEMALLYTDCPDSCREAFEEIRKYGERAANLTRQLLAFSRRQIIEPRIVSLNTVLMDLDKMLRRLIGEHIEYIAIPEDVLRPVWVDPGQIEQVLINLVVNARDAMPKGGKLTIETRNVNLDEEYAKNYLDIGAGEYVMLAVSDTGTGMSREVKEHLFEPFFTTKPKGAGTGLGLSTCYGIVKQNNGGIMVYSEPGRGTTINVYLPVYQGTPHDVIDREADIPRGTETVMLVEDDPGIRTLVTRILKKTGYRVITAANGSEALSLVQEDIGTFNLLITDVVMPLMGGRELAERLSDLYPGLKVMFMSGYTDDSIVQYSVLEEGTVFIQKPFTPDNFLRKVREAMDK